MAFTEADLRTIHTHTGGTSTVANLNNLQTEQIMSLAADQAGDMVLGTAVLANGTKVVLSATMRQSATQYQSYLPAQIASAQLTTIDTSNNVSTQNLSFSGGNDLSVSLHRNDRVEMVPLTGGGFVIAETTSDDNFSISNGNNNPNLYYEVFDNTGAVTKSWTQVNTTQAKFNDLFQLTPTSSGGFDIAWMENNEAEDFYQRFNASGNSIASANHFLTGATGSSSWSGGFAQDTAGDVVVTTKSSDAYTPQTVTFYNSNDSLILSESFAQAEAGKLPTVTNPSPHQNTNPVDTSGAEPQFVALPSGGFLGVIALPTGPRTASGYPGYNMYVQKVSISGGTPVWGTPALVETVTGDGADILNPQVLSDGKVLLSLHPNINSSTGTAAALAFRNQTNYEIIDPSNLPANNSTVVSSTQPFAGLTLSPSGAEIATQYRNFLTSLDGPNLLSADNSGGIFAALQTGIFTTFYTTLDASLYAADFTSALPAPTLTTTPNASTVTLGATSPAPLTDTATVSGGISPTGTITFELFHGVTVVDTETATVNGNGTYTTPTGFTLPTTGAVTGTYQWDVSYGGDANNGATADNNNPTEQVVVSAATPALTTTPNASTVTLNATSPAPLTDTATLSGGFNSTGTITFKLFHTGGITPVDTETVTVNGNGTYTTPTGFTLPTTGTVTGTYQWDATYNGDANNTAIADNNNLNEQVAVSAASPTLATTPNASTVTVGATPAAPLTDTATLSGGFNSTGTITFELFHNGGVTPVDTETVTVNGNGTYTTPTGFTLPISGAAGTYQWDATYTGDANNNLTSDINDATEQVTVITVPTISLSNYDASTGHLTVTGTNFTTSAADFSATALTLTGQDGATYTLTGGSTIAANPTSTSFVVNLSAADQLALDGLLNKNGTSSVGATTYNLAATSSFDTGGNANSTVAVSVSNALTPTIGSVAFNFATGVLTLTGTGFENEGAAGGLRLGDFTLTGQGNRTYTLVSANAAVTSQTSATITLTGADLTNVRALLDKNGTTSADGTTYNLAATPGWDSGAGASIGTEGVTVSGSGPQITAGAIVNFNGGGSPVALDPALALSDAVSSTLVEAIVSIGTGFIVGDTLNFTNGNGITGSYDAAHGILTLSGSASIAAYQAALQSVTYSFNPTNGDPTGGGSDLSRTIDWVANDGSLSNKAVTSTLFTAHVAPTVTAGATASFNGGGSPVAPDSSLAIAAPDSGGQLTSASVTISSGFTAGDMLNFANGNGITGSYNATIGVLSLSGSASIAAYQAALQSVTYSFNPTNGDPTHGGGDTSRTLDWNVGDGASFSNDALSTLSVTHLAPSAIPGATIKYRSGDPGVAIGGGLGVLDPDSGGNLTGATVQITGGIFASDGDVLTATTTGTNIHPSYNGATETLTLTGTDTLANYRSVLNGITFASGANPTNSGADPSRTLTWTLNDGSSSNGVSAPVTSQILLGTFSTALEQAADGTVDFLTFQGSKLIQSDSLFSSWNIRAEGDFNHDGQTELVSQDPTTGQIDLLFVNSNGGLQGSELLQGDYGKVVGAGNFDGNGRTGIATQNTQTGQVDLLWFTGTQLTGSELLAQALPNIVGVADFNGDGKTDLLGQTAGGQLDFLFFNGANLTGSSLTSQSYAPVRDVSNYGAPGNSQIVTQNPTTAQMDFLYFSGTSIVSSQLVDQTNITPTPLVQGGALAAQLFHVG